MFDWIPINYYTDIYILVLLLVTGSLYAHTGRTRLGSEHNKSFLKITGVITLLFVVFYMGLRPVSGRFGDMVTYSKLFYDYSTGTPVKLKQDPLFHLFTFYASKLVSVRTYFLLCAVLYVLPLWIATKKWFSDMHFYAFLLLVVSFSFWPYGTNGIRNGIATSFFLLAISRDRWLWRIVFLVIGLNFHRTIVIPAAGYFLAVFYTRPRYFLFFWVLCIPLSLAAGGFFQSLFASFMEDDRVSYLTEGNVHDDAFSSTGFRWDFVVYSATAVFAGWYYIIKQKYEYPFYRILYCTFLAANGFWILVIKANFSNRFAYLSWFMMGVVIIFPLIKHKFMDRQNKILANIVLAYYGFTFFMHFVFY